MEEKTRIQLSREAEKFLERTPEKDRFKQAIDEMNPFPPGFEKIQGYAHRYRVRVGGYSIIYTFEHNQIVILYIRRRESAY